MPFEMFSSHVNLLLNAFKICLSEAVVCGARQPSFESLKSLNKGRTEARKKAYTWPSEGSQVPFIERI